MDADHDFTQASVGDPYSHTIRAPKLWKESSLGAICDFVGGSQPPKSNFLYENGEDLVRLIQIRDYKSDRHITYIPKKLARRFCNKTDVMIGRYGPPIFQILRGLDGAYNVALMKAEPRTKDIYLEYLYIFLRGDQLLKFVEAGSDRTAGQDGVRKELLTPYPIFLPSLSEQTEIVRRVEALFALADRIEARCTAARTQAQRLSPLVLAKAFRGELVPQDSSDEPASVLLQRMAVAQPAKVQAPRGRPRSQKKEIPSPQPLTPSDWLALPDGAWNAPADPEGHAAVVLLTAVLRVWGTPMPQMQARLATSLCQQPRFFTSVLPADQAAQWRRLVGSEADPLPAQVSSLQPPTNNHWRRALVGMRTRGDLIESGIGPEETWTLGSGAAHIETPGWPEGRAGWVVAYLQAHGAEAILPLLEPAAWELINVKAA